MTAIALGAPMTDADVVVRPRPINVREHCERWARWRERARYYGGAPASGGEYIGGKRSRVCPTCDGDGRMPGHLVIGCQQEYLPVPCPHCDGTKRVSGDLATKVIRREMDCVHCQVYDARSGTHRSTGEHPDGRTCHKCKGGRRMVIELTVHPATIKSTRHLGPHVDPDTISQAINATVCDWEAHNRTYWLARVLVEEYCRNGTQTIKAQKMKVSQGWYSKNLKEAHARIEDVIRKAPKSLISG